MKRILLVSFLFVMLFAMTGFSAPVAAGPTNFFDEGGPHTYTVLVGAENTRQAVSLMAYFPSSLTIHVGDTVVWKANSHEIHTVSFLAGQPMPDIIVPAPAGQISPLMINPLAGFPTVTAPSPYDGTTYMNSGIMSTDPGQVKTFTLTFTQTGTFEYVCIVHGMMMSGTVNVVDSSTWVPSPQQSRFQGLVEMFHDWSMVPGVLKQAQQTIVPPVHNPDGTTTWNVSVGYASGIVDVMRFFPSRLNVKPGDTVVWTLSPQNDAPHTVTFLNGNPDPDLVVPTPYPAATPPVLLLFNPAVLFPSDAVMQGKPLNKTDYFNSGLMTPAPVGPTSFSLVVGNVSGRLPYMCLLHDTSGMVGTLYVSNHPDD